MLLSLQLNYEICAESLSDDGSWWPMELSCQNHIKDCDSINYGVIVLTAMTVIRLYHWYGGRPLPNDDRKYRDGAAMCGLWWNNYTTSGSPTMHLRIAVVWLPSIGVVDWRWACAWNPRWCVICLSMDLGQREFTFGYIGVKYISIEVHPLFGLCYSYALPSLYCEQLTSPALRHML